MGQPRSLLIDQAAELLGVSRRTVYYRIHEGRLRTIRTRCGSQRVVLESVEEQLRAVSIGRRRAAAAGSETAPLSSCGEDTDTGACVRREESDRSGVNGVRG